MSDDRLRRALAELRREQAAEAPAFGRVVSAARRRGVRRRRMGWSLAAATALAAALVVAVPIVRRPSQPPAPDPAALAGALAAWRAPLDFLLEVPGGESWGSEPLPPGAARALLDYLERPTIDEGEGG